MLAIENGVYAKVMVDVDSLNVLPERILVEHNSAYFFIAIEYEKLPRYCQHYAIMGHDLADCRRRQQGIKEMVDKGGTISRMWKKEQLRNKLNNHTQGQEGVRGDKWRNNKRMLMSLCSLRWRYLTLSRSFKMRMN